VCVSLLPSRQEVVRRLRPPGAGSSETPHFVVVQQFGQELVRHSRHPQQKQGRRGLGLEAQCQAIRDHERRRLEANRGLRSRAASELTDRSLPKRSRPAVFIGPSSSLPKLDRLARNDFRRGWPESRPALRLNTPQEAAICWAESGAGYTGKINSAVLLMRGVLPSPDAVGNSGSRLRS